MRLGPFDTSEQVVVIAEIGNNHEGDAAVAAQMVRAAAAAGAHGVKFQAIDPARLVRPDETARLAQLERFRLTPDDYRTLHDLARESGLAFLCTPFDLEAVGWLTPLVDAFKIASGDNDFVALIDAVASSGRPVIVSGGMTAPSGLARARDRVQAAGAEFAALHCVSEYPTPPERAALATIPELARVLGVTVGYSDHTLGIEACTVAAALGARILEKHFTLAHDYSDFRDHQLSADPGELTELVERVQRTEVLVGTPRIGVSAEEEAVARAARRSIVAAGDLEAGHVVGMDDITWLRPADGLPPGSEVEILGRRLANPIRRGQPIRLADLVSESPAAGS